jgi:DNA-binding sugar fermentation-stimulating protein
MTERIERQELHCHECQRYVQFALDVSLNGNHVLHCPNCGHEHCRVVRDGKITDIRWAQRNGPTYQVVTATTSTNPIYVCTVTTATSTILYSSWLNRSYYT